MSIEMDAFSKFVKLSTFATMANVHSQSNAHS